MNEIKNINGQYYVNGFLANYDEVIIALESKVERYKTALDFYADRRNYHHVESASYTDVVADEGDTAREALKDGGTDE